MTISDSLPSIYSKIDSINKEATLFTTENQLDKALETCIEAYNMSLQNEYQLGAGCALCIKGKILQIGALRRSPCGIPPVS